MARVHMNKAEREIADPAEMIGILSRGKYATIGLCKGEAPYVVTLSYGYDPERRALYFHTARRGLKLDFLRANPNACGTVIEDLGYVTDKCSHKYRSVVFYGRMSIVPVTEERLHGLEVMARQLEDNVSRRVDKLARLPDSDWERVEILRLDIEEMTGKKGE